MLWQSKTMWERCYYAALKMLVAFHSMYLNITFTSARCCNFTTPSSIGMYGITTLFTLLIDDYFPLGGPPDQLKWFPPWEVPETSWNKFPSGKSLQNDFSFGKSPRPLRIKEVMPLSTTTPLPLPHIHEHFSILCIPAYMKCFSFFFKFSRDLCRDQGFPPATTNVAPGYL